MAPASSRSTTPPIKPLTQSTFLVREGLYRYTRNPMYLEAVPISENLGRSIMCNYLE